VNRHEHIQTPQRTRFNGVYLIVSIAIAELAGIIGSFFTIPAIPTWYASLPKPVIAPPNWVFAPVWTTLFLLMGIAAFLVWRKGLRYTAVRRALCVYGIQLILNIAWSYIFFGLHNPSMALVEIAFLWAAIACTILTFSRVSRTAAFLLIPYLIWVSFASYLNYALAQ
jgi:tryptophan-rich sensory protein